MAVSARDHLASTPAGVSLRALRVRRAHHLRIPGVDAGQGADTLPDPLWDRADRRRHHECRGPILAQQQQFPPMALLSYTTLALGQSAGRFDFNWALMSMPKRPKLSASQAENLPQVSSGHTTPMTHGKRHVSGQRSQTGEQGLRGIRKDHRVGLCETNIERFKQLPHRMKAVIIEQRSHPLPQQPLAAKLCPHGPKQGTTELLRLIDQKRQHHQHGKHHREMLLAMSVVVLEVVTLILQRVERFIFNLPACPATPHEWIDITLAYPQVRHPTEVLHLVLAHLPVLDEIDPHVCSRAIERHGVDKAKP